MSVADDDVELTDSKDSGDSKAASEGGLPSRCVQVLSAGDSKKPNPVLVVRFNKEGEYAMTGGRDRTPRLWNPHKGNLVQEYKGVHGYEILDIRITSDNARFASVGEDKLVYLWDVATATAIKRMRGHTARVNACAFSAEGDAVLATASYDKTVKIWDNRSHVKDAMQTLSEFTDSVTSVVMTDHQIIAGCVDGKLRTFDIRAGQLIVDHICQPITSIALSNDGNCVLSACLDGRLRLFDCSSGELLNEYTGHSNKQYKIEACLTATDAHVVSGSEDHAIYIWSLVEGKLVATLKDHTNQVVSVAYHPTEPCLISGSTDGTARVWK